MSSGSAPTVLASMSLVSTSHSLSRFGYCCWELLFRDGPPALTAVPPTALEQPVTTTSAAIKKATPARAVRLLFWKLIWSSQSTDAPVLWLCRRAAGTAFG